VRQLHCPTTDPAFANQYFHNNTCLTQDGEPYSFSGCSSGAPAISGSVFATEFNTFLSPNATFSEPCKDPLDLAQWQALGQDRGSTTGSTPDLSVIMDLVKQHL
jgi:hypothetical protein